MIYSLEIVQLALSNTHSLSLSDHLVTVKIRFFLSWYISFVKYWFCKILYFQAVLSSVGTNMKKGASMSQNIHFGRPFLF
jgi:hypothetical protein